MSKLFWVTRSAQLPAEVARGLECVKRNVTRVTTQVNQM